MEIAKFKYCPLCGSTGISIRKNAVICGHCNGSLYENVAAAVGLIMCVADGRIVMAVRGKEPSCGKYDMIGGFIDRGETAEEAVIRETREEVGITLVEADLAYIMTVAGPYVCKGIEYSMEDIVFMVEITEETFARMEASDDVASVELLDPHAITAEDCAFERTFDVINKVKDVL